MEKYATLAATADFHGSGKPGLRLGHCKFLIAFGPLYLYSLSLHCRQGAPASTLTSTRKVLNLCCSFCFSANHVCLRGFSHDVSFLCGMEEGENATCCGRCCVRGH